MCEPDKCCFCIKLRKGCLIFGYINLIFSLMAMGLTFSGNAIDDKDVAETGKGIYLVAGVIELVLVGFSILLLVGLHMNKRVFVLIFMIFYLVLIIVGIIMFFASFTETIQGTHVVFQIIFILIQWYFLMVIRSYYLKMRAPA